MQPTRASHESSVQALPSLQFLGVLAQPVKALHESSVQTLLSSQETLVFLHPLWTSQLSSVQRLLSSQEMVEKTHLPRLSHESRVQALASSHLGVWTQPLITSQESTVQALPSSQFTGVNTQPVVLLQEPVLHKSDKREQVLIVFIQPELGMHMSSVQTFLSSHESKVCWHPRVGWHVYGHNQSNYLIQSPAIVVYISYALVVVITISRLCLWKSQFDSDKIKMVRENAYWTPSKWITEWLSAGARRRTSNRSVPTGRIAWWNLSIIMY